MSEFITKVSSNGRYFLNQYGTPVFWLGDTQWNLFRCHTLKEAEDIIVDRKNKGFSVLQVMLHGFWNGVQGDSVIGEAFHNNDLSSPNEAYFRHANAIINKALEHGITLAIGLDHPAFRLANKANARSYGKWISAQFGIYPNIIWIASYFIPEGDNLEIMRELAAGLREGDNGSHLISCHPDPACPVATSGISHNEKWLDFNCIQTFSNINLIYKAVSDDYGRTPPKPVVFAEGAYEAGPEYGFEVTPYLVRKQAYLGLFAGGHVSYGHNDSWRVPPTWRSSLDAPGAQHMALLKKLFVSLKWWELVPDQSVFAEDPGTDPEYAALRSISGDFLMIYSSRPAEFTVNLDKLTRAQSVSAVFVDPGSLDTINAGSFSAKGSHRFTCPPAWEDCILILDGSNR